MRDAERQKMSKTKGNVIDPLVVTEKYGTDAVRMALLQGAAPGTDIVLTEERMESSRAFANKIWNAARFLNVGQASGLSSADVGQALGLSIEDRWIVSRLNAVAETANRAIEQYRYHQFPDSLAFLLARILRLVYRAERRYTAADPAPALAAFETALRLLHPAMPFLTEELWQRLDKPEGSPVSIALAPYPQFRPEPADPEAEKEIAVIQEIVTLARTLRTEAKLDPKQQLTGALYCRTASLAVARRHAAAIQKIAPRHPHPPCRGRPQSRRHSFHRRLRSRARYPQDGRRPRAQAEGARTTERTSPTPSASSCRPPSSSARRPPRSSNRLAAPRTHEVD